MAGRPTAHGKPWPNDEQTWNGGLKETGAILTGIDSTRERTTKRVDQPEGLPAQERISHKECPSDPGGLVQVVIEVRCQSAGGRKAEYPKTTAENGPGNITAGDKRGGQPQQRPKTRQHGLGPLSLSSLSANQIAPGGTRKTQAADTHS